MDRFQILKGNSPPILEFYKPDPKDSVKIRILGEQWEKQLEAKHVEQAQRVAANTDIITNIASLCPVCNGWGDLISNDGHGGSIECYKCHGTGYL
jgi:hypothetical protein